MSGVEVVVEKVVYGGEGLARHQGRALFIPYVAAGERVLVEIVQERAQWARARVQQVIEASADRRVPPCPYYGVCGGCQLQHLQYAAQRRVKLDFIRESLARLGGISWDREIPILSAEEFHYRLRAQLKVRVSEESVQFGYYRPASHEICAVDACPLLSPELNAALERLRREPPERFASVRTMALAHGEDGRISVHPSDRPSQVLWTVGAFTYRFDARVFFQANRFLLSELQRLVVEGEEGERALDLFCGVGFFTLPLARRFAEVVGVESDARAVAWARRNARENGVTNCRFVCDRAEVWLAREGARWSSVDLVVLDPPREGATRALRDALLRLAPRRIIYVSCNPTTLARDLKVLRAGGYVLASLVALDLFPQTFHIETVATLHHT